MKIKCPHCGTEYEVDKKDLFHYTQCRICGEGFVTGANNHMPSQNKSSVVIPKGSTKRTSTTSSEQNPGTLSRRGHKIGMICSIAGVVLALCAAIAYGTYNYFGNEPRLKRGISYYEGRKYQTAYKMLLPLAKKGYARAQLIVGDCLANGQGVFMDTKEAIKWYRLAADQGLPKAQHRMFVCCRDGNGIERNQENAAKWCRKAAEAGFEESMFDMGMLYVTGTGVEQNAKSALKWFRKGAECGYAMALYKLGQCYKLGYGVAKDEDEAAKWQNKAVSAWRTNASKGDTQSMINLAELYKEGDAVELDKEAAAQWYRKAAELGSAYAQQCLAFCYQNGIGVDEDKEEAAKWMLKSAEQGTNGNSQYAMGTFYQNGIGVEKNLKEAVKWFERATKKGLAQAKRSLAICYLNGEGIQKDEAMAEQLLEEAADAGDKCAKSELRHIRDERAAEERRIAHEKMEKERKIMELSEIENVIKERKASINNTLKGKIKDNWSGFDASKVATIDISISVTEEPPHRCVAENLSEKDSMDAVNMALSAAQNEASRLEERLKKLLHIKDIFDAKELESRKETCTVCGGTGTINCTRCKGQGSVGLSKSETCPSCYGSGQVERNVRCKNCGGKGTINQKCSYCWRQNGIRKKDCFNCGGSGYTRESCPSCFSGSRMANVQCRKCGGSGRVSESEEVNCPVCNGKGLLKCERCDGKGFSYRLEDDKGRTIIMTAHASGDTCNPNDDSAQTNSTVQSRGRRRRRGGDD